MIGTADCLFIVGCKLGEIATKRYQLLPKDIPIIHLDILAEEFGRTAQPTVALWGDAQAGLQDLLSALESGTARTRAARTSYILEIRGRLAKWREEAKGRSQSSEKPINVGRLCHELNRVMPAESVLVADGGFAAHWTALLYDTKSAGRRYIVNRGLASIGYGLPGSLGAQLAVPGLPVVGLTGDGGLNMMLGELETAQRVKAPFTLVVVNNAASGYVKALQHSFYGADRYQSSDLVEIDYAKTARAMGCQGIRVEDPEALAAAIETGMQQRDAPTVVDVVVTRDPAKMLPAIDSRTLVIKKGDRPA